MKTTFIQTIGLALSSMVIIQHSFAQNTGSKNEPAREVSFNSMKKTPASINESSAINLPVDIPYNTKVLTRFNKQFLNVTNIKWSFAKNGNWYATFIKDGALNSILFDKKGNIIYMINHVSEKQVPLNVKELVSDGYSEYRITDAFKVLKDERTIWIVNMASLNHIIQLSVEDGEIVQLYELEKAN
jgi:hypothetical protein